jgi:hypothetical protein
MKQREYYVRKKEGKVASSDGKPSTSRRRTSKKQKAQDQPSFVQSTEYDDKEVVLIRFVLINVLNFRQMNELRNIQALLSNKARHLRVLRYLRVLRC